MIDQNVDPQGWFKLMENVADLHNHKSHSGKNIIYLPLQKQWEIYIILLTEFYFKE